MVNSFEPTAPRRVSVIALAVAVMAYLPSLGGGFLGDDFVYLARFYDLPFSEWPRLFIREWSDGIWGFQLKELRPMAALSFMVESRLWGANAVGYRLVNLILFLGSTWLVAQLAWRYSLGRGSAALAAALVFALHPVQVEPVAWITGRVDLLATCAALVFWFAAERYSDTGRRGPLLVAALALGVGVFSKELSLLAPLLLMASWLLLPRQTPVPWVRPLALVIVIAGVAGLYAWCRHVAFGATAITPNSNWHDAGSWQRQASYLGWLLPWLPFTGNSELPSPPAVAKIQIACGIFLLLTGLGIAWARWKKRSLTAAILFFGGGWWLVAVLPLVVVHYFSPRHLHFGTVGLAICTGLILGMLPWPRWRGAAIVLLCFWFGSAQFIVGRSWREAASISARTHSVLQHEMAGLPRGTVVVFSAPTQWRGAWLFSWSAPHLGFAPFLPPGLTAETLFAAGGNYYLSDHWARVIGERAPRAIAQAPALLVLHVTAEGRIVSRSLQGPELGAAATELASRTRDGITEATWNEWIQQIARP